jgi:hypothetical protein
MVAAGLHIRRYGFFMAMVLDTITIGLGKVFVSLHTLCLDRIDATFAYNRVVF